MYNIWVSESDMPEGYNLHCKTVDEAIDAICYIIEKGKYTIGKIDGDLAEKVEKKFVKKFMRKDILNKKNI